MVSNQSEWGAGQAPAERQETPFRVMLPGLGALVVLLGIFLALKLFFGILDAIREPSEVAPLLDAWEQVVRGESPFLDIPTELSLVPVTQERPSPEQAQPTEMTLSLRDRPLRVNFERPLAIFVLLVLVGLLFRIAIGITTAGVKMIVASPYRDVMQRLITELKRRPPSA